MKGTHHVLCAALFLVGATQQQRSYIDWYEDMVAAFRAGDNAAMAEAAEGALGVRPRFPSMMVNLAIARVRLGDNEGALDLLEGVAGMGLAYPIEEGERFAALASLPRFQSVLERMDANELPLGVAEVAMTLPQRGFFPEGLAIDGDTGSFYLGSVRHGAIVRVDKAGTVEPFAELPWSVLGMKVDRRRRLLWVAVSGIEQTAELAEDQLGRAGIAALDLADGSLRGQYLLPDGGGERVVGDLVVGDDGSVYASDSFGGGVWVLRAGEAAMVPVLPDGSLASPQGLDIATDGSLYVADYNGGIFHVDARHGSAERLEVPDEVSVYGVDGLYFHGDDLLAVQNGISPHRVIRLILDDGGTAVTGATVLLRADERFGEPTLGAVVGDDFYLVANSPWAHFSDPTEPPADESLPVPTVLRLPLSR